MKKYEAQLSISQWKTGSGWIFRHNVVERWEVGKSEVNEWIEDIKRDSSDLFDFVTDQFLEWDSLPDYDKIDNEWCITIVEIDDEGSEKILAQISIWESELAKEWLNN